MSYRMIRSSVVTICTVAVVLVASSSAAFSPPTMEQRLERLTERLEAARAEQHIPGMSIAVVKDDEIIYTRGFGYANVEEQTPASPETIYAIGSTTKAFTANLIGMLVDEGKMSWDARADEYLPAFQLEVDSEDEDDVITIRDMLSHQTGFTRMSLLFINGEVPRDEIIRTANGAEPFAKFREKFYYNNVMFMAAGMAAGEAAESSWEELIRSRIFAPLGMTESSVTFEKAHENENLALGYKWDSDAEEWDQMPMRNIDNIGPAGSINSSVLDMARWVRFQLGHGEFEGNRLLSEESHAETWSPQIEIAPTVHYGFGWMLHDWQEKKVVEHGGNIDGFAAEVGLLPEENLGFVLLTNISFAPLQQRAVHVVFDALVGDWQVGAELAAVEDTNDLTVCEGVYIANYAHFEDEKFTVTLGDDGRLTLDIPSQQAFALDPAGEDGRMPFADVAGLAASFDPNEDGEVEFLRLYQSDLQFEVPREGYEYPIEIPLADLEKYLGNYRFEQIGADVEVKVKNNRLAIDVPGQMVFELYPPEEDSRWKMRNSDVLKLAASFNEDEFGSPESLTFYRGDQEFVLTRIETGTAELPTIEEVFTLCNLDERQNALERAATISAQGTVRFAQCGIEGSFTIAYDSGERMRAEIELGIFGSIRTSVKDGRAWSDVSFSEFEELKGEVLRSAQDEHPAGYIGDWRTFYDEIRVDSVSELDGRTVYIVKVRKGDDPSSSLHIDSETGDIVQIDAQIPIPGMEGVHIPVKTTLNDWQLKEGLRMPLRFVVETQQNGRMIVTLDSVDFNVDIDPEYFVLSRDE